MTFWRNVAFRAALYQFLIFGAIVALAWAAIAQAHRKLGELRIHSGFDFLAHRAGFAIGETTPLPVPDGGLLALLAALAIGAGLSYVAVRRLAMAEPARTLVALGLLLGLPGAVLLSGAGPGFHNYSPDSSYGTALLVGMVNTVVVAALAIVLSTLLGLVIALMRLSPNWLIARLGGIYVELMRNLPLLLHLFFWYFAVIRSLPSVRASISLGGIAYLNNRGLFLPRPSAEPALAAFVVALAAGAIAALALWRWAQRRREATGQSGNAPLALALTALILPPAMVAILLGPPVSWALPILRGFNFVDALALSPEFTTLVLALTVYQGAYSAEIIRAGILAVPRGQSEAGRSLGLTRAVIFRRVVLPQALRVIVPPMISRYLGVLKSSSLAVAIGYPELVAVGHSINHATAQTIEIVALTMAFYLGVSLSISLFLNWYDARARARS